MIDHGLINPYGETLTTQQKKIIDTWKDRNVEFTDNIFGDSDRIYIPLSKTQDKGISPNVNVMRHLHNNGYQIYDYSKNTAIDKYGRFIRIGKVLNQTCANPSVVTAFINDQARTKIKNINMCVCITRNPYDIAAMSTNRIWNSCFNMNGGKFANKIECAVRRGTHVAYLIDVSDKYILKPFARIALSPYHSLDKTQTILHPEDITYGIYLSEFVNTVCDWCSKNFNMLHPIYKKDEYIYNDDNNQYVVSSKPEHERILYDGNTEYRCLLASNTANIDYLTELSYSNSRDIRASVAGRYYLEINNRLVSDEDKYVRRVVALTGHLDHLNQLLHDKTSIVKTAVAQFGHKHHLDILVNDVDVEVRKQVVMYGGKEHLDILVKDKSDSVRRQVALYGEMTHVEELLSDESSSVVSYAKKRLNFNERPEIKLSDWSYIPNEENEWQQ